MPRDEPFFRKCCVCIPLKTFLLVWACIKWIVGVSLAVFLIYVTMILVSYENIGSGEFSKAHLLIIVIGVLFIDSVFMIVLAVGLCRNNVRTLNVYYYYMIYMTIVSGSSLIGFTIFGFIELFQLYEKEIFSILFCLLINFVLDICIIFTLKSKIIKLRNKQLYEFMKMPNLKQDEETAATEPFQAEEENNLK